MTVIVDEFWSGRKTNHIGLLEQLLKILPTEDMKEQNPRKRALIVPILCFSAHLEVKRSSNDGVHRTTSQLVEILRQPYLVLFQLWFLNNQE
jgi:hypothetical protein